MAVTNGDVKRIADEVFDTLSAPREVARFSDRFPGFGLTDAYRVVEDVRRRRVAKGQRVIGRKIGFTNSAAWAGYGINAPIWNYLYDASTIDLTSGAAFELAGQPNVRMEAEVAFGLGHAPEAGMDDWELLSCVQWAALDFEICTSIFAGWNFQVADAAATGVHVALLIGPRHEIGPAKRQWLTDLSTFPAVLSEASGQSASGGGFQVLKSPVNAMRHLVSELARYRGAPLQAGDIVTTGTLTAALPAESGQRWQAHVDGIAFEDIAIRLT